MKNNTETMISATGQIVDKIKATLRDKNTVNSSGHHRASTLRKFNHNTFETGNLRRCDQNEEINYWQENINDMQVGTSP